MKLVAEIGGHFYPMNQVEAATWDGRVPMDMIGVSMWFFEHPQGGLYVWPKPIPECKIYRLEEQGYVKE